MAANTIIIGAGVAGIAMAHTLKWRLGYTDFEVSQSPWRRSWRPRKACRLFGKLDNDTVIRYTRSGKDWEGLGERTRILVGEYNLLTYKLAGLKLIVCEQAVPMYQFICIPSALISTRTGHRR